MDGSVLIVAAVAKIETKRIDPGIDQLFQHLRRSA
jgi:hypothetical protein